MSAADEASAPRSSAARQPGCFCLSSAAAPATCGAAIDVPEITVWPGMLPGDPVPAAAAATMPTPGAVTSGLTTPPAYRGPLLENGASRSARSTAPTVKAPSALPGDPMTFRPALPAATTKSTPVSAVALSM